MIYSIHDAEFEHKRVLVRVDFNVPLDENGSIADDSRIKASLSTVDEIIDKGGIPLLISHFGRPKGEPNPKYSLKPIADYLRNIFGYNVIFVEDCIGEKVKEALEDAEIGHVLLLENLRFHQGEEKNDKEFARQLAENADAYVNDAFGAAHRAHASTAAVAELFEERYAGVLMVNELDYLGNALAQPHKPFTAVIGGAKISGKIDVIRQLFTKCENILIGGGMMFTFLKAQGFEIGNSIVEEDKVELAKELIDEAAQKSVNLILPKDTLATGKFDNDSPAVVCSVNQINPTFMGLDIGPETIKEFSDIILSSKTIFWNGPMGVFELSNFAKGTLEIAKAIAEATSTGAISIVGGGDSAAAVKQMGYDSKITHVSTGGGASLEFLEGKELPGVKALER